MKSVHYEALGRGVFAATNETHTFGTDALLLADFAAPKRKERVCDLCSGCGIVPLIFLRNEPKQSLTAVEIQADGCALIEEGLKKSNRENAIAIVNADLREWQERLPFGGFDLITINPPYFKVGSGYACQSEEQQLIRSEVCCTVDDFSRCAARLLRSGGRLCLCHRPERLTDVIAALRNNRLEPKRLRFVTADEGAAPWLFLLEAKKDAASGLIVEKPLSMKDEAEQKRILGEYAERE
ncbi:MAG: methyltransferase [Clostridia bacterium]|nr:methyltransferase [Clostridia bacterium]